MSEEVARLLFSTYEVDDPDAPGRPLTLPRGHILMFGGDTAYPVATELEIHNRVIVPYNRVLRGRHDGRRRVLMGVPGNHDWYAGLDGFGCMFRERRGKVDRASTVATDQIDRAGQIGHFIEWIEAFRIGRHVAKRPALPLEGYTPVQTASYWALRLAPKLDLWGIDRQLRVVDFHQKGYFAEARENAEDRALMLCLADPVHAFLEPSPAGVEILEALDLSLEGDGLLVVTGDTHHYCRQRFGAGLHVTAGGGGAFLHPTRILRGGVTPPEAEFPGPRACLSLALRVPWLIARGRSGFLLHATLGLLYLPTIGLGARGAVAAIVTGVVAAVLCLLVGGWRQKRAPAIAALSVVTGAAVGALPWALDLAARSVSALPAGPAIAAAYVAAVFLGALVCGSFLTALTVLGLEQHQAFGALAHPGYKHFVRLRVRKDGRAVEGWVLGKVDPLGDGEPVVLVDRFRWDNPKG